MAASPAEAGVVIAGPMLMECNPVHILDFPAVNTKTKSRLTLAGTLGKLRTWTGTWKTIRLSTEVTFRVAAVENNKMVFFNFCWIWIDMETDFPKELFEYL